MSVRQVLIQQIAQLNKNNRGQRSKPIHVLEVANQEFDSQLKQRLKEAKNDYRGERLVLIPYHLGNTHWTIVFIDFSSTNHVDRAELINPVNDSQYIPDELQHYFRKNFPTDLLRIRTCKYVGDRSLSANLTVENVLEIISKSAGGSASTIDERTGQVDSLSSNDSQTLKRQIETAFNAHDIKSEEHLKELISEKKKRIEKLKNERNSASARMREESLSKLENLQSLVQQYNTMNSSPTPTDEEERPMTSESLRNIYHDFHSIPSSSERSTLTLLYYVSLLVIDSSATRDATLVRPDHIEDEIKKEFDTLKDRLRLEDSSSLEIQNVVGQLSIHIRNENWNECLSLLRKLFKKMSPLNVHDLFRLVEKVDDAAELIKDKDIILLLGGTGSGKSTTIHFLAGSKMIETKVGGMSHIAATDLKYPSLRSVIMSPYMKSETRCITPINVNFEDMGVLKNGSIVLCDTPGFEDTNGPEVDVANGISIVRAIGQCKSVRPVVLVSYRSIGDRLEGVKALTHLLAGLIPGIKDQIRAFSYIFTNYPVNRRDTIHASLENLRKTLSAQEKSDTSFLNLFTDMLEKTRKHTLVLDPVRDKPAEYFSQLIESPVIQYPDEVFQFSITEKSKVIVHEQVRKYQLGMMSAMKRYEYHLIKYQLDKLKRLNDLLNQDYIEQIYTDCIRHVSRHLSDEYEEGTSMLNRCLMHQTVLSAGDIQQYRTYIQHAHAAENLRKDHFDNETIHSSAFIQYLNQQVVQMEADLLEKEIDDSSIKVHLDKIKLLTESFPEIQSTYQSICQSLTEKIALKVKPFESFVSANQFHECAAIMSSLSDALNLFHHHLDDDLIKKKYSQLRRDLINSLINSVKALEPLFRQAKLEKEDIERMDACLVKLKIVLTASSLEVHVSKRDLEPIHNNYLAQILKRFESIIGEMKSEFKKQHALPNLEILIQQLDLIRTISSVALETSEVYYSTLEELFGYIIQLRRDAEELLRVLFQGGETVDFEKLVRCLASLKSVTWIEKYRVGLYSDVINNVEQLILQHVDRLKRSIMHTNLDLGHAHEIKQISKRLSDLNDMKHLASFIPTIHEHIEEANTWFQRTIRDVLQIIQHTFALDRWNELEYRSLESTKTEKAFQYLEACKEASTPLKAECSTIMIKLEGFVRGFSEFVQKEMETCFETVKKCQETNVVEIFDRTRTLANRLQEVFDIEKTCPNVLSHFSKRTIVQDWQTELSSYNSELSTEMARLSITQRTEALNSKLTIAKALSKLDKFVEGAKYLDLYNEYQKVFLTQNNNIGQKVIDAITNFDYEGVAVRMMTLQSSSDVGKHFYTEAKRPLNAGLDQLIEATENQVIMLGSNIPLRDIAAIVENLKRMERAKQFIAIHLDAPEKIDDAIKYAKGIIGERIKRYLVGVRALVDNQNFYEADDKIDSITKVRDFLGKFCTKEISDEIENLNAYRDTVVLTNVDKYSNMDISAYSLSPPTDIFEKFGRVNQTNAVYKQALDTIRDKILAKFRAELAEAKSRQPPDPENMHIRRFESAVKYLPEAMRYALEVELKHCKEDIEKLIQDNEHKLSNAFNSGDVRNIKRILLEYENSQGLQSCAHRVKALVLKQIHELVQKINDNFERNEMREAFTHVKKLYTYKTELDELISDVNRPYSEVRLRIIKIFDDAYLTFTNRFLSSRTPISEGESVAAAEKTSICLIEFIKFKRDHLNQTILIHILPDSFNARIEMLICKIQDYAKEHQTKCQEALENIDADSLLNLLKTMATWNSLITKINIYYNMYNNRDTSMEIIMASLEELAQYSKMLQLISRKIEVLRRELLNLELLSQETREFSTTRDEFYRRVNDKFVVLNRAKSLSQVNNHIDIERFERECLESLESKIRAISSSCEKLSSKISQGYPLTRGEYDQFNLCYCNLISIRQEIKVLHLDIPCIVDKIAGVIFDQIQMWEAAIGSDSNLSNVVTILKNMKRIANNISLFRAKVNERIDDILRVYKNRHEVKAFAKLGTLLNQDKDGLGQSIIAEHRLFQGFSLSLFNEKTKKHDINYVLSNMRGNGLDTNRLGRRYAEFHGIYQKLVQDNLRPDMKLDQFISDTKLIIGDMRQNSDKIVWDAQVRYQIPRLAAHVFALWTLSKADHYFEAEGLDDRNNYLVQPHAAQVISIFRLLSIGDSQEELTNNLIQIRTGEGKSIVLAVTAIILVLVGFDVNCACFSEYLSQRDYLAFLPLFESLETQHYIHYGTFNKLCEDLINENDDIRQRVEKLISSSRNENKNSNQQNKRPKILLIDEVDVFFSRDFYGNVYTPAVCLEDPTITSLVNLIWTRRKSELKLRTVHATPEYQACKNKFPSWILLIDEAIKDMIADVQSFESHDYVVKNDKIGYIEQDNIVFNVIYGYKTLFAYQHEHEKGNISKESLQDNISIRINCGSFSYAEIPLQFQYIMGVTGTLETLSDSEKKVITGDYQISKNTYVPSVFGQNNLRFIEKDDIKIERQTDYFNRIKREIDDRLVGVGRSSEKRAVLVFFESEAKLMQFYQSPAFESMKESVVYLTEDALLQEKQTIINRATVSGQVTLFTRTFGRGTDFICHDQVVVTNGGTHVIQTFLSEELSEETQIKGRTARQGDQGSYSMILLEYDLEKFHIERSDIEDIFKGKGLISRVTDALRLTKTYDTLYDFLHDRRTDFFKTQYEENIKYVGQAKEKHRSSQKFLASLRAGDIDQIRTFLVEENRGAGGVSKSRTVCLMDATGSMTHLLHKCKNTVDVMFERAAEILKDQGMDPNSFQLQFAVYRNYSSSQDKLLQSSPWETKPQNLRAFMNSIEVQGGWGNEAIEIGLWHANQEYAREPITQVILIGDAPPNTIDEVKGKRDRFGQKYWKKTKFAESTDYEKELSKLVAENIPVHAFYVDERAQEKFTEIAKRSHGRCEMLDINSRSGSDMLTDLVTEEILNNVGGQLGGKDLVIAYRKKFSKSYTSAAVPMTPTNTVPLLRKPSVK